MDIYEKAAQQAWEAVLGRVKELVEEGIKPAEISRMLGHKGRSAVSNWISEKTTAEKAEFPDMLRYIGVLGLNPFDFIPQVPMPSTIRRPGSNAPAERVEGEGLISIPVLGETGAGHEVEIFEAEPSRWLPVLPQYAKPDVVGLVVSGDSMEPTIRKGAVVGIVPYDGTLNEGGIYLIQRPPWGRMLKRVKIGPDGQIVLHSDNEKYEPFSVPYEGYESLVAGRVVWIWQEC